MDTEDNKYSGTEILNSNLIELPIIIDVKEKIEKLKLEISMLILEKDNLFLVECKNIETEYLLKFGELEYKIHKLQCDISRVNRKIQLIQIKKNRQELINKKTLEDIEIILDKEFEEYLQKLSELIEQMRLAVARNSCEKLSQDDIKELKKLYREIVKKIHPDVNSNITEGHLLLFQQAVNAYESGDLDQLRIISFLVSEEDNIELEFNTNTTLEKEKERLENIVIDINNRINLIKKSIPYIWRDIVTNEVKTKERKQELELQVVQLSEMLESYNTKLDKMLE